MTLLFAICPGCKTSITMPEGYVSFGPWLSAHQKTCPGERTPKVVARVRRTKEKKLKAQHLPKDPQLQTEEFVREVGARAAVKLINTALDAFFKGVVKP